MKTTTKPIILGCLGLALGTMLTSCVDPYYAQGPQHRPSMAYSTGYEVRTLPPGYRTEMIEGTRYYHYNGTYYRPRSGRYVVVEAPRHYSSNNRYDRYDGPSRRYDGPPHRDVVITHLPSGYRVVEHRGTRYYQVQDRYYQQRGSGYVIVGSPF